MARLKGLILSSSSVAKAAVEKKRKHRGKRTRETWGPGDFPPSIKTQAPLSPHRYPRKRHSVAKENQDPQTLFRVYEDGDESATKDAGNSPFHAAVRKVKPNQAGLGVKESSKQVLDLFAAVLRNCRDENVEDPMAAIEALANEKSASLGDIERARAFDVLADIRTLMVENMQSRAVLDEKLALEQELKDLRAKLNENPASFDCSENAPKAGALVEEIMAELESTQEALATEKKRCQDLETEKTNSQHMAAEELDAIQSQLETLKLQSNESQQRFDHEKRQLQATIESLQSELPQAANDGEYFSLRSKMDELESLLEEMKASRTVLQLAVAERDEEISSLKQQHNDSSQLEQESRVNSLEEEKTLLQQKIVELEQQVASTTDNAKSDKPIENAVVEKLAGELQNIMQELAQLQSDHERAALEKQELQADAERMSEELEISQRQGYELSETLMQKEHIAKVLQAQLDAKLMTISQMQQRLETESKKREKLQLDVQSYEETLSVLRKEAKDSSVTIADLLEKMEMLETDLDSAARTQERKDEKLASLTDALARSKEEQQEMRLQSKQRLVAAEGKEMALEEKISALEQQLTMNSNGVVQMELIESREKQTELQTKVATLENQLTEAREEQIKQDDVWNKKQAMAEREFARFTAEQKRLREELTALHSNSGASKQELEARAEELQKTKQSCTEILEQKQLVQEKLESTNAAWDEKQQELVLQMDSIREQFQEAQNELEEYQKNADGEIHRLRSVIEEANAEIEELKCSAKAKEEEFESQIGKQEDWQIQVKNRQEALQAKCDELDDERRLLKEKYAVLEAERGGVEEQLQNEILELSEKCASAQAQQATYQGKLKEMEAQLEMTENDAGKYRKEFESLAKSLKSSQVEAVEYHNQLVEAQLAKENMEKLVEKQKARIDKLEKVKMTTETLDLFRKLKKDRHDLQVKVQELQNDLAQAEQVLKQYQENHQEKEQRLVEDKDEELKLLKEHVEELRNALRAETQRAADMKAEMRAALSDEREKAEHEIQEMQALVKEKMELVEKLEAQVASVQDAMVKLQEQKSENVAYLEKENLDLHVENRELKKQLESALSPPEKDELMGDTDGDDLNDAPSQPQEAETTRAGGFLLSTNELDAIAAQSQEDPHDGERPECSQQ
ncbi:hypothetical protein ON010_g13173 [Phytophthora cinnamomi]|nr:hypothetical protein ON010_g13173 [Phytophthora cinnamomi]